MNDDELITAVKESVTGVHMDIPAGQIVSRSRAIRARRRTPALAGALAVAAGTALAVTALLPSGHQPSHPARARLAAWTVVKQADGGIRVTIHELRDPARLQSTLRADGVPVSVTFIGQSNPACQPYGLGGGTHLSDSMVTPLPATVTSGSWSSTPRPSRPAPALPSPPATPASHRAEAASS